MELIELGMNRWFREHAAKICESEQLLARVTVVDRGQCIVRNEQGEVPAKATGKFMYSTESSMDMPCVGDWVCMDFHDSENFASIHTILPRKSFLRRKADGNSTKFQMIAANIDVAFIVQSCHYDFSVNRLERYLVMAKEGNVEPVIVLTKIDLVSVDELEQILSEIREAGIDSIIIAVSNETGVGLPQVQEIMDSGRTYCLVGSSGVGKSTLINQLTGQNTLRTGTVRDSGEGRHTTVRRQLIILEQGAMLIDTPGMRQVGILCESEEVEENFDDIHELSESCRFANCSHTTEPGCAVSMAIKEGDLLQEHFQNYVNLKKESELNTVSHADKRKKNKRAGNAAQPVKKHKR